MFYPLYFPLASIVVDEPSSLHACGVTCAVEMSLLTLIFSQLMLPSPCPHCSPSSPISLRPSIFSIHTLPHHLPSRALLGRQPSWLLLKHCWRRRSSPSRREGRCVGRFLCLVEGRRGGEVGQLVFGEEVLGGQASGVPPGSGEMG